MLRANSKLPVSRLLLAVLLTGLCGCPTAKSPEPKEEKQPFDGVTLSLTVVDDPPLAKAIEQLRGEWSSQTGADFSVVEMSLDELRMATAIESDALVVPSAEMGALAERKLIAPLPNQEAFQRNEVAGWGTEFDLLRLREAVWGNRVMGVPFGSPVYVLYYRADLLEKLGRRPPQSWPEYYDLARLLNDRSNLGDAALPADAPWSGALEPLGPHWAALTYLAHTAPFVKSRSNYSVLFDISSFQPLIGSSPFVFALDDLVKLSKLGSAEQLDYGPAEVRNAFWQGRCGLAITWPSAASAAEGEAESQLPMGVAALPGAPAAFDPVTGGLVKRLDDEPPGVPLISMAGRLGVLGSQSKNAEAATQLLLWLSSEGQSASVSPQSAATTLFRDGHIAAAKAWVEPQMPPDVAVAYGRLTRATMQQPSAVAALPLPGRQRYLAALDEAVRAALRGEKKPVEALAQAAQQWREISLELGVEKQKAAYRRSLGL